VEFEPEDYLQMAGLICFYDTQNFYYLRISRDEKLGKCLGIIAAQNNRFDLPLGEDEVRLEGWRRCYLRAEVNYDRLQFYYSPNGGSWEQIGTVLDAATLSDECCQEGQYTGAFVGLGCHDQSGQGKAADFDYFEYEER
jgi:xylan 1,4-beta-xylosidase